MNLSNYNSKCKTNSSTINTLLTFCNSYAIIMTMERIKINKQNLAIVSTIASLAILGGGTIISGSENTNNDMKCVEVTAKNESASSLVDRTAPILPGESGPEDVVNATGGDYSKTVQQGKQYKVCGQPDGTLSLNNVE
jgi:hypothetical protein